MLDTGYESPAWIAYKERAYQKLLAMDVPSPKQAVSGGCVLQGICVGVDGACLLSGGGGGGAGVY